jgi:probable F420-dependent oxidoreductase
MEYESLGIELADWLDVNGRVELARWAESNGFGHVSMPEITDPDALVTCGLVGASTSRIRFGTSVVQIGPRTVPMLASGAATVATIAPGRFELGIGVSTEAIIENWHGLRWEHPLTRARETVLALRKILLGQRTDEHGDQIRSRGFRLAFPPAEPPPILLAGLNERMLELAGEIADGAWLSFVPVSGLHAVRKAVAAGATRAGRPAPDIRLSIICQVTDDPEGARREVREILTFYVAAGPYRKAFAWHGFAEEMEAISVAFNNRDKEGVRKLITDRMVSDLSAIGSANQVRDRLLEYADAGLSVPTIAGLNKAGLTRTLETIASWSSHL